MFDAHFERPLLLNVKSSLIVIQFVEGAKIENGGSDNGSGRVPIIQHSVNASKQPSVIVDGNSRNSSSSTTRERRSMLIRFSGSASKTWERVTSIFSDYLLKFVHRPSAIEVSANPGEAKPRIWLPSGAFRGPKHFAEDVSIWRPTTAQRNSSRWLTALCFAACACVRSMKQNFPQWIFLCSRGIFMASFPFTLGDGVAIFSRFMSFMAAAGREQDVRRFVQA